MEAKNPYHLKTIEGYYYNKYPEFQIWEEGYQAGLTEAEISYKAGERKVVEWVKANALFVNPHNLYWQEFLKSEGIE